MNKNACWMDLGARRPTRRAPQGNGKTPCSDVERVQAFSHRYVYGIVSCCYLTLERTIVRLRN